ncbi:MAG: helix-turn-helix domain-containing protein [Gemmatimonadota bacterium]
MEKSSNRTLMTVGEVAGWLRVSASTVYEWAAKSRIPCVRVGGRLRLVEEDLHEWIEGMKEG